MQYNTRQLPTTTSLGNEDQRKVDREISMRVNDEKAQERIDTLEALNLVLSVQNQLLEEEVLSLKVWGQQKFADTEMSELMSP